MAVLKWDLDIVDLPDVLKQEVEAIQDLMESYIVNGVKMVVKKRDGGKFLWQMSGHLSKSCFKIMI